MLNVTTSRKCPVTLDYLSPCMWVVAQLAEHRTVTAAREGSTPFDPPKLMGLWTLVFDLWTLTFGLGALIVGLGV